MGNRIKTRNSPDILLGMILQFEFLSKNVLKRRQNARMSSTHVFLQSIPSPIRRSLQQDHNLWDVIANGDLEEEPAPTGVTSASPAPKTRQTLAARKESKKLEHLSSSSNSASQNLAFLSSENTSSTNEVINCSGRFWHMDGDDLEELDLQWQVAMLTVRVKKSGRIQGRRSYGDNGRAMSTDI
ncbi:hypothetical protein Tco_0970823 [Tanacetum coccineum]